MTAIGRGQRQLVIGDRQTGKTAVCLDTILNQRELEVGDPSRQVRCIYVAIGQKGSTIASVKALEEYGAMEYDHRGRTRIRPAGSICFTGIGYQPARTSGDEHVLIVFDDLSKQAEAYRAVSLLLRPGREAYPGDVFYLHSHPLGARKL